MQFSTVIVALAGVMGANAAISLGEQFRGNTNVNYNVAWVEGIDPCRDDAAINLVGNNPCNIQFTLDGQSYHLSNCGTSDYGVYNEDGSLYGRCLSIAEKKISCGGATHDVIKHYICG